MMIDDGKRREGEKSESCLYVTSYLLQGELLSLLLMPSNLDHAA